MDAPPDNPSATKKTPLAPPTYLFVCLLIAVAAHYLLPIAGVIPSPYRYAGILLIVLGGWVNIWADGLFKKRGTTVKPFEISSALITDGPFRFSRHPMYLGMVAILLGVGVLLGSVSAFAGAIAFFVIMSVVFIPAEERAMEETFGEKYLDYKARVRRWL
jgi:protein-S-isoprenylcysteine O-methyltransferase Ste14